MSKKKKKWSEQSFKEKVITIIACIFFWGMMALIIGSILCLLIEWTKSSNAYFFHRAEIQHPQMVKVVRELQKDDDSDDVWKYYVYYQYEYNGVQYQGKDPASYNSEPQKGRKSILIDTRDPSHIFYKATGFLSYLYVVFVVGAAALIIWIASLIIKYQIDCRKAERNRERKGRKT